MPKPYYKLPKTKIDEIIRVDHAGEFGAQRIYQGQIDNTIDPVERSQIQHMLDQEIEHLEYFKAKLAEQKVRPSFLLPIWSFIGYYIGSVSSMINPKTAMLVTEAVENVIEEHYQEQIELLECSDPKNKMIKDLIKFRQDELDHKHIAIDHDSRAAPFAVISSTAIHYMCQLAINLSKKI